MNANKIKATCHIHGCDGLSVEVFRSKTGYSDVMFAYCAEHAVSDGHTRFTYVEPYNGTEEEWV